MRKFVDLFGYIALIALGVVVTLWQIGISGQLSSSIYSITQAVLFSITIILGYCYVYSQRTRDKKQFILLVSLWAIASCLVIWFLIV